MQNKKQLFIGVTGGIGSGKTLVCEYFKELGCTIFYADAIAKHLYTENEELKVALFKEFGEKIIGNNGEIDFDEFRTIVFKSDANQKRVNSIVHPFVIKEIIKLSGKAKTKLIIIEAALIFESGFNKYLDYTILIYSSAVKRIERIKKRSGLKTSLIKSIMKLQMAEKDKKDKADFIINNKSSKLELKKKVRVLHDILKIIVK
jgi:dephospho-CoA kinase